MPGDIYSARLLGGTTSPPTELIYTVATGFVVIVTDVCVFSTVAGPSAGQLFIGGVGTLAYPAALGLNGTFRWTGRQVVNAGESLYASAATGTLQWLVSGYVLTAV